MTEVSRRSMLGVGAAALAASAFGVGAPALAPQTARAAGPTYSADAGLYRRDRFVALDGKRFSLTGGGKGYPMTLVEVADLDGAPGGAPDQFRLTLTARGAVPDQGTYTLRRPGFDATSLFVVSDPTRGGVTAIVNSTR